MCYADLLRGVLGRVTEDTVSEIVRRYPSVADLADASTEELRGVPGVGPTLARRIPAVVDLGRQFISSERTKGKLVRTAQDAYVILAPTFAHLDREVVQSILLDIKHRVLAIETVSIGTLCNATVHPRELFRPAILRSAAALLVAHNHPSGDTEPSPDDLALTRRLKQCGELIGISVLDHLVVAPPRFTSLKERGCL